VVYDDGGYLGYTCAGCVLEKVMAMAEEKKGGKSWMIKSNP
jgi:hypothetical protein